MSENLTDIHLRALKEFHAIHEAVAHERRLALQDRRFYSIAGAQWEGPLSEQFANRPKFEANKTHLAVIKIFSEYRNNRIGVNFIAKGDVEDEGLADTCAGLHRADESDSTAEEAYDNAFEEAVGGGFGAWRLRAVAEDEESYEHERQKIVIEPLFDADSTVFFDLAAKRQDKSDARHCFVISSMSREAFDERYGPTPAAASFDRISTASFDWLTPDLIYLAEYYRIVDDTDEVVTVRGLDGTIKTVDADTEKLTILRSIGFKELRRRVVKRRRVRKYLMDGSRIIEDYGYLAGRNIPIVPLYGKRWYVDGIERFMGHVRLPRDVQIIKNMQLSKLGELSAQPAIEKPIFFAEQIAGHETTWASDPVKNYRYLLINPITNIDGSIQPPGPIGSVKPPDVPPVTATLLQVVDADIRDLLGHHEEGEKILANVSGSAIELVQNKLDMQTYIYVSNMAKAKKRSGEIWLSMASDLLVEQGRKMKAIDSQERVTMVELNKPALDDKGRVFYRNDLSKAKFDVAVTVGPSSTSQRSAIVKTLVNMLAFVEDPETRQVLSSMIMLNLEGEGIGDVRNYFKRKMLLAGVLKPTEREAAELEEILAAQAEQGDPNAIFLHSAAQESIAKAELAKAKVVETLADADLKRAKTVETLSEINDPTQPKRGPNEPI